MSISDTATRLLRDFGDPVTLSYETAEVRDGPTGEVITPATTVTVSGFGYPGEFATSDVDGNVIKQGDVRLTLNKVSEVPQVGWKCEVVGKTYRVMNARRVRKAASDVIYILQLRI